MIPSLTNTAPVHSLATPSSSASGSTSTSAQSASSSDSMVSEQTFLQLLVAQLENQDPLDPQDGTQFVAQLAQFSCLEQEVQMRQDLDSINSTLTQGSAATQGTSQS
ncbi:MAG TPA: flagellar hook capping FlgD N-terminal domain-containing protein [Bryobacteraceae bacterium]|nr:flagellar hook capping FlgD N-terminal domain-containing protein [Bryobacteraceae bacterium]